MHKSEIVKYVMGIINAELAEAGISKQIDEDSLLVEDVGLDSVQILRIASMLEKQFDVVIEDDLIYELHRVGDLCNAVEQIRNHS